LLNGFETLIGWPDIATEVTAAKEVGSASVDVTREIHIWKDQI
jgi:hypothetical protein